MPATPPHALSRDAALLALSHLAARQAFKLAPWSDADGQRVHLAAAHLLDQQAEAARILAPAAERLVAGIALVSFVEPGGPFGPAWRAHPLVSPGWHDPRPLREPDATGALATFMGPSAGLRGQERALSFLQVLTDVARADHLRSALGPTVRPSVAAEHPVKASSLRRPRPATTSGRTAVPRIDLLFDWPVGPGGQRAVVVVEAKLGSAVGPQQLKPYREEATRLAKGGPVALILLTVRADKAEARHRAWRPVRWLALLRRWEVMLAAAGDDDPEFARLRAVLWRYLLS